MIHLKRAIIERFTKNNNNAKFSLDLLWYKFLEFFDFVPIIDPEERKLVEFLTAEGCY